MAENKFKTKNTGKEYPARLEGLEFTYQTPDGVAGATVADVQTALQSGEALPEPFRQTLVNILGTMDDAADAGEILARKYNGQGYDLDWQKALKDFLGREEEGRNVHVDRTPEEVQALAVEHMRPFRVTVPTRGAGTGGKSKVARAEARAAQAEEKLGSAAEQILGMYRGLNKGARRTFRDQILAGGIVTSEQLDEVDAEA
jgi:hypothetical protein